MITRPLKWIEHLWQHVWDAVYCKIWVTITLELECFETRSWFQSLVHLLVDSWCKSDTKIVFPCSTVTNPSFRGVNPNKCWIETLNSSDGFGAKGFDSLKIVGIQNHGVPHHPASLGAKIVRKYYLRMFARWFWRKFHFWICSVSGPTPSTSRFGFHWREPVCGRCRGIGSVMRKWWCRYQFPATVKMIGGYFSGFSIHFNGFSSENPHKKWECHLWLMVLDFGPDSHVEDS